MLHDQPLRVEGITSQLGGCALAAAIVVVEETTSTNDLASQHGRDGDESLAIFAERQTAGRGRFGRRWESAAHRGLWFSLLLRPELPLARWTRLTTWAAVGVAAAIEETSGCRAAIKWPNDVLLLGKKVAGILIETGTDASGGAFAVVGIGVNVNHETGDFPPELADIATSLRLATFRVQDRAALAAAILRELDRRLPLLDAGFHTLIDEATRRSSLLGRSIEVRSGDITLTGLAEHLDEEGRLLLRTADGTLHALIAGEATLHARP